MPLRRCCCCQRLYALQPTPTAYFEVNTPAEFEFSNSSLDRSSFHTILDHRRKLVIELQSAAGGAFLYHRDHDYHNQVLVARLARAGAASPALDPVNRLIYFASQNVLNLDIKILVVSYEGLGEVTILDKTPANANDAITFGAVPALVYARATNHLFFKQTYVTNQFGAPPPPQTTKRTIQRINPDGSGEIEFYDGGTNVILQMAVDNTNGYLWWTERTTANPPVQTWLRRCPLLGGAAETMLTSIGGVRYEAVQWSHSRRRIFWIQYGINQATFATPLASSLDPFNGLMSAEFDMSDQQLELSRLANNVHPPGTLTDNWSQPAAETITQMQLGCGLEKLGANSTA